MSSAPAPVVVFRDERLTYPETSPFDPPNPVYSAVEAMLARLGLDARRAGSETWNPLGDLVGPGSRVVIKPNLVTSRHFHERLRGDRLLASSTHASVLRPLIDYALRAVGDAGEVRIVDSPVEGCEVEQLLDELGIASLLAWYGAQGRQVSFVDLRRFKMVPRMLFDDLALAGGSLNLGWLQRVELPGDPRGYRVVDLGRDSRFEGNGGRLKGLCFHRSHRRTPQPHHRPGRHEYSIAQSVLDADLIIGTPKLKTHKKTGVTLAQKSVIGLTDMKYWLPHFRAGAPPEGDEYEKPLGWMSRLEAALSRLPLPGGHSLVARWPRAGARPPILDGCWQGNDTLWRTILDLNRIVSHADRSGVMRSVPQRILLHLVDGIMAGEGDGPLNPTPRAEGILVAGFQAWQVDLVATRAMGLPPERLPMIVNAMQGPAPEVACLGPIQGDLYPRRGPFAAPTGWPDLAALSPSGPRPGREHSGISLPADLVEERNDRLAREHPIDDYYAKSPALIRWIEGRRLAAIRGWVGTGAGLRILEVGSGGGHVLRMFPEAELTAVDVSGVYLDTARKNLAGYKITFLKGELADLGLPPASFDRVICTEVLEHTQDPGQILAQIQHLLKPEGRAVITIPIDPLIELGQAVVAALPGSRRLVGRTHWGGDAHHIHRWWPSQFVAFLEQHFIIEERRGIPWNALPLRMGYLCRSRSRA